MSAAVVLGGSLLLKYCSGLDLVDCGLFFFLDFSERADCFTLIVLLLLSVKCSVSLPHGIVGWLRHFRVILTYFL